MQPLKPLSKVEKQKVISRLFWDKKRQNIDVDEFIESKVNSIDEFDSRQFFVRMLTSCDWYTLVRLLSFEKLEIVLNDQVLDHLFPKELKEKYIYARSLLSKFALSSSR
jgi:hypothetical protein